MYGFKANTEYVHVEYGLAVFPLELSGKEKEDWQEMEIIYSKGAIIF